MIRLKRFISKSWFIYLVLFLAPMVAQLPHNHTETHSECGSCESDNTNDSNSTYNEICFICEYHFVPAIENKNIEVLFDTSKIFLTLNTTVLQCKASEQPLFQLRAPPVF